MFSKSERAPTEPISRALHTRGCIVHSGQSSLSEKIASTISATFLDIEGVDIPIRQFSGYEELRDTRSLVLILDEKFGDVAKLEPVNGAQDEVRSADLLGQLEFVVVHTTGTPTPVVTEAENTLRALGARKVCNNGIYLDSIKLVEWLRLIAMPAVLPTVRVMFGTNKGTTRGFAESLGLFLTQSGIRNTVERLNEVNPDKILSSKFLLILLATWRKGDVPPDTNDFMKHLEAEAAKGVKYPHVQYAVCSFGSAQLETFCFAGMKLEDTLAKLGCRKLVDLCKIDRKNEETFSHWKVNHVLPILKEKVPLLLESAATSSTTPGDASPMDDGSGTMLHDNNAAALEAMYPQVASMDPDPLAVHLFRTQTFSAIRKKQLCQQPDENENVFAVRVDVQLPPGESYITAGDVVVLPENDPQLVLWFFDFCSKPEGVTLDTFIHHIPGGNMRRFPTPCTIRKALTSFCDLNRLPGKAVLATLSGFSAELEKQEAMKRLLAAEDAFSEIFVNPKITFQEFLSAVLFDVTLPLFDFLQLCPLQAPRTYSISSSSLETPDRLSLSVALLREKLRDVDLTQLKDFGFSVPITKITGRYYEGVCSSYLCKRLAVGASLDATVTTSRFSIPKDISRPVILVAGGSGIGPIRAVWREYLCRKLLFGHIVGHVYVYFGNRYREKDWLYKDELQALATAGDHSLQLDVRIEPVENEAFLTARYAFSRDQNYKVYVDCPLIEDADELWRMMHDDKATIFVCGSGAFMKTVNDALKRIANSKGDEGVVERWRTSQRLMEEEFS